MAEDDCVKLNRALNRELAEAEELLRLAQVSADEWLEDNIEAFLNRKW